MAEPDPRPVMPARGAVAGVKQDQKYNPVGTGTGWSHNFLNQKPWHPLNFRNQVRKYDAEQKCLADKRAKEIAEQEFRAQLEREQTMSFLSEAERKCWQDRQSISFMYTKPPGLEAALARDKDDAAKKQREQQQHEASGQMAQLPPAADAAHAAAVPAGGDRASDPQREAHAQRTQVLDRLREDPFTSMLAARAALASNERWEVKHAGGLGHSPPRGGVAADADNQRLLGDDDAEDAATGPSQQLDEAELLLASLSEKDRRAVVKALERKRRKADEAAKLAAAHEVLRAAGLDPEMAERAASGRSSKHKKDKSGKKDKERKQRSQRKDKRSLRHSSESDSGDDGRRGTRQQRRPRSRSPH